MDFRAARSLRHSISRAAPVLRYEPSCGRPAQNGAVVFAAGRGVPGGVSGGGGSKDRGALGRRSGARFHRMMDDTIGWRLPFGLVAKGVGRCGKGPPVFLS